MNRKYHTQQPIVIDCFAGGGGASMGIEQALGRPVDEAINHDPEAVAMHQANHPKTRHWTQDIMQVRPAEVTRGRPVGLLWASPECTHHSRARGGKPRENQSREMAWVVVDWAREVRPAVIMVENVSEWLGWGPLGDDGLPIKAREGETFRAWVAALRGLGYAVEWRELRACDYGAPTIRQRVFLIARCDGEPIRWPRPTHGKSAGQQPYRTAAECIDFSLPCPSIFLSRDEGRALGVKRPLVDATMRRIAHGVWRFVINAPEPFIIPLTHQGHDRAYPVSEPFRTFTSAHRGEQALVMPYLTKFQQNSIGQDVREPLDTVMAGAPRFGLVAPTLIQMGYGEREGQAPRVPGLDRPLGTVVAGGRKHALVAAFLAKHFTGAVGAPLTAPLPTTLGKGAQTQLVSASLIQLYGTGDAGSVEEPLPTVTAGGRHTGLVSAFLMAYYGSDPDGQPVMEPMRTLTTKERFALVMVHGVPHYISDIGMRMLTPRELYRAQGFPEGYIIAPEVNGKSLSKTAQIRCCGNSVCPDVARALVAANVTFQRQPEL